MIIAGIDPGLTGAVAFMEGGKIIAVLDLPIVNKALDAANFYDILYKDGCSHAFIEKAGPQPVQGVRAAFKTGEVYGTIVGVLMACHIPTAGVSPTAWKKYFGLSNDKEASRAKVIQWFPSEAKYFARKKDHGRAEAVLIAIYGAEKCGIGKNP